ncbi:MAG: GNAT family N-acetyltransferase, partial [Planctomycetota bacterium]
MEIRELSDSDAAALIALYRAVLPDSPTAENGSFDAARAFLVDPTSFVLGAYDDDEPVGLAWGVQMRSPSGRLTSYLHELDVRGHWRRRGIGAALVRTAMDVARRHG